MEANEIKTCYDCGKEITGSDELYFDDSDLCKQCYCDKEEDDNKTITGK